METNQAAENLQVIRTLMERSALYRRALAPIMLFLGSLGLSAAVIGASFSLDSIRVFAGFWMSIAVLALTGAFLIARRQALREHEPFWSPPTRRITQAMLPPLIAGCILGIALVSAAGLDGFSSLLAAIWIGFYGCALHAAGFFMPRGMKVFGWFLIVGNCAAFLIASFVWNVNPHWTMGFFFGALHLAYGAYLYLTEPRKNVA